MFRQLLPSARLTARLTVLEWTLTYAAIAYRVEAPETYAAAMAVRWSLQASANACACMQDLTPIRSPTFVQQI